MNVHFLSKISDLKTKQKTYPKSGKGIFELTFIFELFNNKIKMAPAFAFVYFWAKWDVWAREQMSNQSQTQGSHVVPRVCVISFLSEFLQAYIYWKYYKFSLLS